MGVDLVLRQGRIWSEDRQTIGPMDITICDGHIHSISARYDGSARRELHLEGMVVLPGLVNCHTHLDKAFMGHHAEKEYDVLQALNTWNVLKDEFTISEIAERARRAVRLAIHSGTTTIRSCVDVALEIGLIGVEALLSLKEECRDKIDIQLVAFPQGKLLDAPGTEDLMREALKMGVDVIGGRPHSDQNRKAHIDLIFEIAQEFDRDIDMSVDAIVPAGDSDPNTLDMKYYAEKTIREGYQGRVTAHHAIGLSSIDQDPAAKIVSLVADAQMNVITNPTSNLYTEGRTDKKRPRRGLTRVKELLKAGVNVVIGTDNLDDVFMPHVNGDMLREAYVASAAAHLGTEWELGALLNAITYGGAKALGFADVYGIAQGKVADLVILETDNPLEAITRQPVKRYVIKNGSIVLASRLQSEYLAGI